MKKLLVGLCVLIFLVGSGLLVRGRLHSVALAGGSNNGEPDEEQNPNCSPTNLFVGYVDDDGPDGHPGIFFPQPFAPDPHNSNPPPFCTGTPGNPDANGCIFVGKPGSDALATNLWDAGVIRIDNPSSTTPLVVQNVTVDIGPSFTIDVWGAFFPITIPPNGKLILTEDATSFNFDTSDLPPGSEVFPTCTPDGFKPLIHVTVGTSTQLTRNFSDTTQVLNTQGVDGLCPPAHNEGHDYVQLTEVKNKCECDSDENGDDNGQNGGEMDKGNEN